MGDYVLTEQGPVHDVDYGGTGPGIVLVHGLGGSTTNWDAVGPDLARRGRTRAIDLPGFGLTPPRRDYRVETHRDAVVSYLETLGGDRQTLIGNSTGGLVSEMVASSRPDLVDRLILVSPATPPRFPDPRFDWPTALRLLVQATPWLGEAYGRWFIRSNTPAELARKTMRMVTHKPGRVPMRVVEASVEMAAIRKELAWTAAATTRTASSVALHYARPRAHARMVRSIMAPTLVIQGLADHIVSPTAVEWMCSLRPDWKLIQLEDTGHTPQMDASLRFLDAVNGWFETMPQPMPLPARAGLDRPPAH